MLIPVAIPLVSLLLVAPVTHAAFQNDFSSYPKNAQQCLNAAATKSGCSGNSAKEMNSCLCSNGGNFVTQTAKCLGSSDATELGAVYDTMSIHCSDSQTPLTVSKVQFLKDGGAASSSSAGTSSKTTNTKASTSTSVRSSTSSSTGTSTTSSSSGTSTSASSPSPTSSPTSTSTSESTPTETGKDDSAGDRGGRGGLSSTARAGLIAGSVSGGILLLGLMAFFFVRNRRRNQTRREEADPMLLQKFGNGDQRNAMAAAHHDGLEAVNVDGQPDPKWRQSQRFNWDSPYEPAWSPVHQGGVVKPEGIVHGTNGGYHHISPDIHELESPDIRPPIELAATPVDRAPYSGSGW